MIGMDKQHWHY